MNKSRERADEAPAPAKRPLRRPVPAGLVPHLLGSFRRSLESAREVSGRLCLASCVVSLSALAGWAVGPLILARGHSSSGPLSSQAAACFLLLALALYNYNRDLSSPKGKWLLITAGLVTPLLALGAPPRFFEMAGKAWASWVDPSPYVKVTLLCLGPITALCPLFSRRRLWAGDMLGGVVLLFSLVNALFILGYLRQAPISFLPAPASSPTLLYSLNALLMSLAVMGILGPRHFPLRPLSGSSVRAVLLRHFLPVTAGAVLIYDLLRFASAKGVSPATTSFLVLLFSMIIVIYLSLRSSDAISRRLEGSLRESEERYTVLVDSLKDHAAILLDPARNILTWNAGAEHILGYQARDVLGDSVSRFYPSADLRNGVLEKTFGNAARQGIHEAEARLVRKDGAEFWGETVTSALFDQKNVLLGFSQIIRDITDRRNAEEAVKEQSAFMKILQAVSSTCNGAETMEAALPAVLQQVCLHTHWTLGHAWTVPAEGGELVSGPWHLTEPERFTSSRDKAGKIRFIPGRGLPSKVVATGEPQWIAVLSADPASLPRLNDQQSPPLAAGYAFPLKAGSRVVAVLEFFSERSEDLTPSWRESVLAICRQLERVLEREEAERALRTSERRFRSLTQTANDAIVSYDVTGVIAGWNRGAKSIFGWGEDEVVGKTLGRLIVGDEKAKGQQPEVSPILLTDMTGKTMEFTARRKNGETFPIDVSVATWTSGMNVYFTAIMRDATVRKRAQALLTASLHEKEVMLKEIHHRVKNNLQMISSLLRLQSEKIQDPALLSVFLESQNRVRSMAMIHECLYRSHEMNHIDFSEYVAELSDSLLRTYAVAPEDVTMALEVDNIPLDLDVAIPCGLIVTELVSNALKYAFPGGRKGRILVRFRTPDAGRYELTVADDGAGMKGPVDFESTESLGLRLVRILTQQLRGKISVENEGGTRFTVTLKAPDARPKTSEEKTWPTSAS